ncbi:hypothetical protein Tco_0513367, partial [Tanacetum coccineum]
MAALAIALEIALEVARFGGNGLCTGLPDYFPTSDVESHSEEPSKGDPSEDDSSGNEVPEIAGPLEVQAAPAPLQIIHALPASPRRPVILVRPRQAIPFGRPHHIHPNG